MPTLTATVEKTVELAPRLKRRLLTELKSFQELRMQKAAIEMAMEGHKNSIEKLRLETGEVSLDIEGFKITLVQPAGRATIDKKRLLENGVTMGQIENSTIMKAVKGYTKIYVPGDVERAYE